MTTAGTASPGFKSTRGVEAFHAAAWLLIAGAAWIERGHVLPAADVAWYLTVVEKWFDGARLYVDVLDNNPPFSIWLYAPFVFAGRALGVAPESCLDAGVIALSAASVGIARWIDGPTAPRNRLIDLTAFAILVLLPAATFGQREHFALIFFLPCLGLADRRARGAPASRGAIPIAGACCALVLCIKPHFALALAAATLAAAWRRRSWRTIFSPENWIAAVIFCVYVASTFALYPEYWSHMAPLSALVYLPVRTPLAEYLYGWGPVVGATVAATALIVWRLAPAAPDAAFRFVCLAAACGFIAAALAQGKGWPYHFYPAFGLMLLLLADFVSDAADGFDLVPRAMLGVTALVLCAEFCTCLNIGLDTRFIQSPLSALKSNPRVITIASDLGVGFPAVRSVHGVWVGRSVSLWASDHAATMAARDNSDPNRLAAYHAVEESDRRNLAEDISGGKPDIIIVQREPEDYLAWAQRDPALMRAMSCFASAGRTGIGGTLIDGKVRYAFELEFFQRGDCDRP